MDSQKFMVAYKRPKNLKDILVHSKLSMTNTNSGTVKCLQPRCQICQCLNCTNQFMNNRTSQIYHTQGHIDCTTKYVIYLIQCSKCSKQYVGQTSQSLRTRAMQHRNDIRNKDLYRPVAVHFNQDDHVLNHLKITGICLTSRDINYRLATESAWIRTLGTVQPWGMNLAL